MRTVPAPSSECQDPGVTEGSRAFAATTVVAGSVGIQLSSALAATMFHAIAPADVGALRLLVAGAFLLALTHSRIPNSRRPWWAAPALGGSLALNTTLNLEAISRIPLGCAAALGLLGPIAVVILTTRAWQVFVAAGFAVLGVLLIVGTPDPSSGIGVLFGLGSAATVAFYLTLIGRLGSVATGIETLALGLAVAGVVLLPLSLHGIVRVPSATDATKLLAVGLLGSTPYIAEFLAARLLPAGVIGVLVCFDPAAGAVLGFLLLHQRLGLREVAGIAAVMAGVIGSVAASSRALP